MDYSYSNTNDYGTAIAAGAIGVGVILFMLLFVFISYAIVAFLTGRIFKKAGVPQWVAWVPVYNTWKLLQLGDQQGFWAVLAFIPLLNIISLIFVYLAMYRIGLKLGKEGWFVLLAIFLPLVWLIWLAFDESKWQGGRAVAASAPASTTAKKPVKKTPVKKSPRSKKS